MHVRSYEPKHMKLASNIAQLAQQGNCISREITFVPWRDFLVTGWRGKIEDKPRQLPCWDIINWQVPQWDSPPQS